MISATSSVRRPAAKWELLNKQRTVNYDNPYPVTDPPTHGSLFIYVVVLRLMPFGVSVCFLADRGFADIQLMRYLRDELKWHFRIRVKSNAWINRPGKGWKQLNQYHLAVGEVVLLQGVKLTKTHAFGSLNLALGRDPIGHQAWFVATDEPASLQTFHTKLRSNVECNSLGTCANFLR